MRWFRRLLNPRAGERGSLAQTGFAVRTDWPDGTHLIFGWRPSWRAASRLVARDRNYWLPGPLCPVGWSIVAVSRFEESAHHRRGHCEDRYCPTGAQLHGRRVGPAAPAARP